ncbi:MAG: hypothetical protein RLQ12_04505 [Cyclobacteriaceae bacterium]
MKRAPYITSDEREFKSGDILYHGEKRIGQIITLYKTEYHIGIIDDDNMHHSLNFSDLEEDKDYYARKG